MGFHISWLAVRGKSPSQICEELNIEQTAQQSPFPESDIDAVELKSGWYLVHFNRPEPPELSVKYIKNFSKGAEVVTCIAEESAMISMAGSFTDGEMKWSLVHDSTIDLEHIEEKGTLPDHYQSIKKQLLEKSEADDGLCDYMFDLPIELAKSYTQFRHDDVREDEESNPFIVMARKKSEVIAQPTNTDIDLKNDSKTGKPWWQFW